MSNESGPGRVLLVDDEPEILRVYGRALRTEGHTVDEVGDGAAAEERLRGQRFDVVVSDIAMPGLDGLQLLKRIRGRDLDLPVILMTARPAVDTATRAVEHGALRYLLKPIDIDELRSSVAHAVRLSRLSRLKRAALGLVGGAEQWMGDRAGLEVRYARAVASATLAFQPLVHWSARKVFGYEALARVEEPAFERPEVLFSAATRLGRREELGRLLRERAAATPPPPDGALLFVNVHGHDLLDDALYDPAAPLSRIAARVVLEITDRAALEHVSDLRRRAEALRALGFRIALDDLGAGYAALGSLAELAPEIVKLDVALVRGLGGDDGRRLLIGSLVSLCREMGLLVVAEGVETVEERDALVALGCDLLQGRLLAEPGPPFPEPRLL